MASTSFRQWRFAPAAALACGVWAGAGALLGGVCPLLYPGGSEIVQPAMLLGSLGGLLGGVAWCIHMIRGSALGPRSAWRTVRAGAWLGLAVTTFYGAILQAGIAYLVQTDLSAALAPAAVSLAVFTAPAGFIVGLVLGWMWAGMEALPPASAQPAQPPVPVVGPIPPPEGPPGPPPIPPLLYQDLLTPHQRTAFTVEPELDLLEEREDDGGADQRDDRREPGDEPPSG